MKNPPICATIKMLISCDVVNIPYSCFYEREETKRCRRELDSYYVHTVFRYAFSFPRSIFFCLLTVFTIRVTTMRVKEADIQEKWPRVTKRSLEKFTSQVFHVCYVTAALQQIAVQFGVGKVKWINLKKE